MFHINRFQPLICVSSESQSIIIATQCRNQEENYEKSYQSLFGKDVEANEAIL